MKYHLSKPISSRSGNNWSLLLVLVVIVITIAVEDISDGEGPKFFTNVNNIFLILRLDWEGIGQVLIEKITKPNELKIPKFIFQRKNECDRREVKNIEPFFDAIP